MEGTCQGPKYLSDLLGLIGTKCRVTDLLGTMISRRKLACTEAPSLSPAGSQTPSLSPAWISDSQL